MGQQSSQLAVNNQELFSIGVQHMFTPVNHAKKTDNTVMFGGLQTLDKTDKDLFTE